MINNKRIIAIIPARGGSKGLPGKNIRLLNSKPLIAWSIEQALNSIYVDTVMVTTDDGHIAEIAGNFGAEVPFLRPIHLATDTANTYDVIRHTIDFYSNQKQYFEYVLLLEPTSPLRQKNDIDRAIETLDENCHQYHSLVTLGEVSTHPCILKKFDESGLGIIPYVKDEKQTYRRQDNAPAYFPYGVAYLAKVNELLKENTFYMKQCMGMKIERSQCYEIDDLYDFLCVEAIMKNEKGDM